MKKLRKRCAVLAVSSALLSAYVSPIVQLNAPAIVYAQADLENATYEEATPTSLATIEEIFQSILLYGDVNLEDDNKLVLTEDGVNQVGAIALSEKFDFSQPFNISGKINLGNKVTTQNSTKSPKGGDGISFLFLDGKVGSFGLVGETLGLGKIKNSFGFKLDTHHNRSLPQGNRYADADPYLYGVGNKPLAFGSFIYSNYRGNVSTLDAQILEDEINNTFVPFTLTYGGEANPNITFTYGQTTFTRKVDIRLNKSKAQTRSFGIFASTIDGTNKQQIQIDSLQYTAIKPKIIIRYVDDSTGKEIKSSKEITGKLDDIKEIVGVDTMVAHHQIVRNNLSTAKGFQSENSVKLLNGTQTVTYTYRPIYKEVYPPVAKEGIQVEQNKTLSAEETLQNFSDLPKDSTVSWKEAPKTSVIGETTGIVLVTYPDNTVTELPITIHVVAIPKPETTSVLESTTETSATLESSMTESSISETSAESLETATTPESKTETGGIFNPTVSETVTETSELPTTIESTTKTVNITEPSVVETSQSETTTVSGNVEAPNDETTKKVEQPNTSENSSVISSISGSTMVFQENGKEKQNNVVTSGTIKIDDDLTNSAKDTKKDNKTNQDDSKNVISSVDKKTEDKKAKTLPYTGEDSGNVIYLATALIGSGLLIGLAQFKRYKRQR